MRVSLNTHCSFFFRCYDNRRDPHSFPTRRSSDLNGHMMMIEKNNRQVLQPILEWIQKNVRSEEHTSELQSRQYLVCRLLLEKKKKEDDTKHNHQTQIAESRRRAAVADVLCRTNPG